MRRFIDILAGFGLIVLSVGVYLEFGLGFSLICAGASMVGVGLLAARVQNVSIDAG